MKKLAKLILMCLVVAIGFPACKRTETFELTKEQILKDLGAMNGEIVDVVGDNGPYRSDYTLHGNYGEGKGTGWASKGGHKLEYPVEKDFYHVIHVYVNKEGGALLVGRRVPAPSDKKSEQVAPSDGDKSSN